MPVSSANQRFLTAFREVEAAIADRGARGNLRDAIQGLARDGRLTVREAGELDDLYSVRNLLTHVGIDGQEPFEVSLATVRRMDHLRNRLTGRAPTIETLLGRVETVPPDTTMSTAVQLMAEHDYTCLPIYDDDGFVGALDADVVMHWVGDGLARDELLLDAPVSDVRGRYADPNVGFCRADALQRDVAWTFQRAIREESPLVAILATDDGTAAGRLRGIITPWDVPGLAS